MNKTNPNFVPDDKWDGLILKVNGELYLTDWGKWDDLGAGFFPCAPDIEVTKLSPDGAARNVGVLGVNGIFDCAFDGKRFQVTNVADWSEIEIVPEWESDEL